MIRLADIGGGGAPLYQLKIKLRGSMPTIWRRIVVRSDMKLDRFHKVLQIVVGWENCHAHHFISDGEFYGKPDPDWDDSETLNEKRFVVAHLAAKKRFIYEYDFGDGWEHEVTLERTLPPDPDFKHPVCVGGENACPPEDCGGIHGYAEFLTAIGDPSHTRHEELVEWAGGKWDPSKFNLEAANAQLRRIKA